MLRNFIIVKAFGSNFPRVKKTSALSVGLVLGVPSPVWDIICPCRVVILSSSVVVAEKKSSVCANLALAFLARATMRSKRYVVQMSA